MPYTIPHTDCQVIDVLPNTHVSPETAYVVEDYPYGFRLRCSIRYWLDCDSKRGVRMVSQTTNPKAAGIVWNKPKASTYSRFGAAMFIDQNGHVMHSGLSEYVNGKEATEWCDVFADGVPGAYRRFCLAWAASKVAYDAAVASGIAWNSPEAAKAGRDGFAQSMIAAKVAA